MTWAGAAGSLPRSRYLTEPELRRLLAAVDRVVLPQNRGKFRTLFLLLVNFGPRIKEALAVRAADVDLHRDQEGRLVGNITFPTLKRWRELDDGMRIRLHVPRTLPLHEAVAQELKAYISSRGVRPGDLLFPRPGRKKVWEVFKRALHEAGLSRHYCLHDLRHSAGTRLADKTRDPMLVRDVLGHASLATSNIYLHTVQMREKLLAVPPLLPGDNGGGLE